MLADLHLIADAFLADDELGRRTGSDEPEIEGTGSSEDLTRPRRPRVSYVSATKQHIER